MNGASDTGGLPSGTVTFLLTDVEGSTRLWERRPDLAEEVLPRHRQLIGDAVEAHGGRRPLEQGEGDNVVAAFARATDAVRAAHAAQVALGAEPWPTDGEVRVRMALHTGEVEALVDGTYAGPALNRCARLRALGAGGQVLVSSATADLVADALDDGLRLTDLGVHRLRDLGRPEQVWELRGPGLDRLHPPLRSLDVLPHNLPIEMSSFVGRADDVAQGVRLLDETRLLTFTGAGGCGKTRLALRAAAEAAATRPGGTWWVELAPVRDPALVGSAIAGAVGVRVVGEQDPVEAVADEVQGLPTLVVLDNCEHLVGTVAAVVDRLLRACPHLQVMATSREPLAVEGEVTWRVPSLSVPPLSTPLRPEAAGLAQYDAVRLFIDRAVQVRPRFVVDNANAPAVAQICHRLDGIPLAIELAAARVRSLPPERIARELDDRFRLLAGGSRAALPRQQTLEASVAWSHDLLADDERVLFRRLAVFAGPFDVAAAEEIAAGDLLDRYEVLDVLDRLVDKSLVQADDPDGRFALLETIRQYGLHRLTEAGETAAVRDRHLAWALATARSHEDGVAWTRTDDLDALDAVRAELRAACEWALSRRPDDALALVGALGMFWASRGHYAEGLSAVAPALELDDVDPGVLARARWAAAYLRFYGNDVLGALDLATQALDDARALGDDGTAARCLHTLGTALLVADPEAARSHLTPAIDAARAVGDAWCEADSLQMRAYTYLTEARLDEARTALDEATAVSEVHGGTFQAGWHQIGLAIIAAQRCDLTEARRAARQGADLGRRIGDPAVESFAVLTWVTTLAELGRQDEAQTELRVLLDADTDWGVMSAGRIHGIRHVVADDDPARIAERVAAAAEQAEEVGLLSEAGLLWPFAARAALDAGQLEVAASHARRACAMDAFRLTRAHGLTVLAASERAASTGGLGPDPEAERHAHEALAVIADEGYPLLLPAVLAVLGGLARDAGSHAEAARLLAASRALGDSVSRTPPIAERAAAVADLDAVRRELGDEAFGDATNAGAALTAAEVVAYARRARGERGRPSFGWDSLTPTELQVVSLAAEGLTNPQIAEQLLMSRETVKTHLAHVFAKLGVANRTELARAFASRST